MMRHVPEQLIVAALWMAGVCSAVSGQVTEQGSADRASSVPPYSRFAGWDQVRDPGFRFDPDVREIQGFSVRATTGARIGLAEADKAFARGDPERASRRLLEIARGHGGDVVQVAGGRDRSRWVGAAEWALQQLITRSPKGLVRTLVPREDVEAVELAARWRDLAALQRLAWRLEGTPSGAEAAAALAGLLAERGALEAAAAAARRALSQGASSGLNAIAAMASDDGARTAPLHLPPSLAPQWTSTLPISVLGDRMRRSRNPFQGRTGSNEAPIAPVVPVVSDGVVYLSDSVSTQAVDLISGRSLWHHAGPLEVVDREGTGHSWFEFGIYASSRRSRAISPYQLARPALAGDILVGTEQATERRRDLDDFEGYPINHPLPRRRLMALDRHTGELLWRQERPGASERAFVNTFNVAGPATLSGGIAYVSGSITEGAINAYLAAFDLETGDLVWRTLLCSGQQELTMFNRPFQEHVVSAPLLHEGSLYVSTNLGILGCVDAWSGRVRWLSAYKTIPKVSGSLIQPDSVARDIYWVNQPPFLEGGTLFVSPLDSEYLLALDPATGRRSYAPIRTFRHHILPPIRHQAVPTGLGRILLLSGTGLETFDAASGTKLSVHRSLNAPELDPDTRVLPGQDVTGAATLAGGSLLIPCERQLVVLDVARGQVTDALVWEQLPTGAAVQRAVPGGPGLVMVDGGDVFAHLDRDVLRAEAVAKSSESSDALLTLAELELVEENYDAALVCFEELLQRSVSASGAAARSSRARRGVPERARTGRLEASLRHAREQPSVLAWNLVLEVAHGEEELFARAAEVLTQLDHLGAGRDVSRWLGVLAEWDPERLIAFGDDGSQAAGLLDKRRRLPYVEPAQKIELLQQLLLSSPYARWGALSVREQSRQRIDGLLETHGRDIYEAFEQRARLELERGLPLEVVELRFPNALAVSRERARALQALIDRGAPRQALEEAALVQGDDSLRALRARAARALGETAYADLLEGSGSPDLPPDRLARLPEDGGGSRVFNLHDRFDVVFRPVSGRPGPPYEGCAVGCVNRMGEMFLIDTTTGRMLWDRVRLPGGVRTVSGGVDFHMQGDLLSVRGGNEIEVVRLQDGSSVWSRRIPDLMDVVNAGGLVLALREVGERTVRVDAFGLVSGAHAFSVEIASVQAARDFFQVGPYVVLSTRNYGLDGRSRDNRLHVLDLAAGSIASSTVLDPNLLVVNRMQDPPTVLLSERVTGTTSRLVAWSPASADVLWEAIVPGGQLTKRELFPSGPGRLTLLESAPLPDNRQRRGHIVHAFDARTGQVPGPQGIPLFSMMPGVRGAMTPSLVMLDPESKDQVCVVDGATGRLRYLLDFQAPLEGYTEVYQGQDGFVIVSEDPASITSVWIVRGEDGTERYSVLLDDARHRVQSEVMLVDDALLLAIGGSVHVIRSGSAR